MKKGLFAMVLALICAMVCMFGLVACNDEEGTTAVESVTLNKTELTLEVGDEETLTVTVAPDDATDKTVTWTSDNTAIATVENGNVTAVAAGNATITAKAGDKTASCSVTVNAAITYTVTEEEWNEALDLKYKNLTFTYSVDSPAMQGEMTVKLLKDGSLHQICSGDINWCEHIYKVNSDNTVFQYYKNENNAWVKGQGYDTLEAYEQGGYGDDVGFMANGLSTMIYDASYVFDDADNSYKREMILQGMQMLYEMKFENQNLVYFETSTEMDGEIARVAVRFYDYGTTEITFPTV